MTWITEHLGGLMAVVVPIVGAIVWLARLEAKVRELQNKLKTCQSEKVKYIDVQTSVHTLGDKIQATLVQIIDRLARVETALNRMNGGGRK